MDTTREGMLDNMIREAGWFAGTSRDWDALPDGERSQIAFAATGCSVAYPTWPAPVHCVHATCRVMRCEIPAIALTTGILQYEAESGWLRWLARAEKARIFRAVIAQARRTGVYDPWLMPGGWQCMVSAAMR